MSEFACSKFPDIHLICRLLRGNCGYPTACLMMARGVVTRNVNVEGRTKVKTGCATCRIRKIKCDEAKPFCQKCVRTGRTCDGYQSPFRVNTSKAVTHASTDGIKPEINTLNFASFEVAPQDIDLLNRCFSTKTMFDVKLGCDDEARQVLQASLTDPAIRHAVLSLVTLREDLETSGDGPATVMQPTSSHHYGIQQYNMALGGLVSNLSLQGSRGLTSALLCCQIFISIEQVRKNYTAMAQHIIRGLSIMREYQARPGFIAAKQLVPAHHDQLPFLDVFVIKMFAAPCKLAEPPATANESGTTSLASERSSRQQLVESRDLRNIAPNVRTALVKIATSTIEFLDKVSHVEFVDTALQLLSEKAALLGSLESWLTNLELIRTETGSFDSKPVSLAFLRMFHLVLRIVLLGALESSSDLDAELQTENGRLQSMANEISDRLKTYRMSSGTNSS